jgi:hypothetical protein
MTTEIQTIEVQHRKVAQEPFEWMDKQGARYKLTDGHFTAKHDGRDILVVRYEAASGTEYKYVYLDTNKDVEFKLGNWISIPESAVLERVPLPWKK